jgi:hypothetical protein
MCPDRDVLRYLPVLKALQKPGQIKMQRLKQCEEHY